VINRLVPSTSASVRRSALAWLWAGTLTLLCAGAYAAELPDFTRLVKERAGAVVNIGTVRPARNYGLGQDAPDWLRRFVPDQPRRPESLGSGFIISADGYVLTNYHVVEGAEEVIVRMKDRRELTAVIVGLDERSDLALLKVVTSEPLPTVELGSSGKLEVGEWVLAIGSPFGFNYSVTAGIVSAKGRSLPDDNNENYVPFIQTDVAINPGNSGGPLFNLDGEVVGINSQIYTRTGGFMGVSFAIPIDVAMEVVDQLIETGNVSRGWLGVVIQSVDRNLAQSFGLERPAGALVSRVLTGSPAEAAGIVEGDIILRFNDLEVDLSSDLPHLVGRVRAGTVVPMVIFREGAKRSLSVKVGELAHLAGRIVGLDAQSDIGRMAAHPGYPAQDQTFPQADLGAEAEYGAEARGQGDRLPALLPQALHVRRIAPELAAGLGQLDARMGAGEQGAAEIVFQRLDARADRRLGDVEALRRAVEAAAGGDFEEGLNVIEVHGAAPQ